MAVELILSIVLLILLDGNVHLNPGPSSNNFAVCTLNIRSSLKAMPIALYVPADNYRISPFSLTETKLSDPIG
jgi:hypothetical protein